jgi:transcriptional regulator with XRE-family HTH domain
MKLPERMLDFRARNNMSQRELAEKVKVTIQTINSIERGIQEPSRLTRKKIELVIGEEGET